jgi:hypothetical protein
MSEYYPDKYVMVRITDVEDGEVHYRVMGTWYGGFASGDYYRLNSGVEKYERTDNGKIRFYGGSGSVYEVDEKMYGMSLYAGGWLEQVKENSKDDVDIEIITLEEFEEEFDNAGS